MPAPKKSIRPKMRPKDMTPKAERGDSDLMKIEGRTKIKEKDMTPEAERGDADLMRLEKGYKDGGAVRPETRRVDRSTIEMGGVTPIRALAVGLSKRGYNKKDRKYQDSLKDMGMFESGGGRADVPKYRNGGVVRGCKSMQSSGKGFKGTY